MSRRPVARSRRATPAPVLQADTALLARVPYFRTLPPGELARLAARCVVRTLRAGQTLFEEGEPASGLFVVADGAIEVRQVSRHGREQVFHTEGPAATLGEAPLLDGRGYIASAVAREASRVLFLPRADLVRLCHRHPVVALTMAVTLARRLRRFADLVADLAFRRVNERLARYLDDAAGTGNGAFDLALTQAQLAARLGTVRELVARSLGQLEAKDVIRRNGARIVIRDRPRLAALARGDAER